MLEALLSLESVRVLKLARAQFEDQDIARPKAKALEKLDLAESNANDALLLALRTVTSLRELNLSKTLIKGDGMGALRGMEKLQSLNLSGTDTMPAGAKELEELTSLVRCDLSHTNFNLSAPDVKFLTPLTRLQYLNLDHTAVEDESLKELDKLTALRELSLEQAHVSDRGLAHIKSLKNLTTLRFYPTSRDETNKALFELKKRIPSVRIADLVLRASGVSRNRDQSGEITSLTIRSGDQIQYVNRLIDVGELMKLTDIELSRSDLGREGWENLMLPATLLRVEAHQVRALPPQLITKIAALPKLARLSLWDDSLTDESRAELKKLADRAEVILVGQGGTTRLRNN
jgi:Leucine Rich Repeat (LRR) protein